MTLIDLVGGVNTSQLHLTCLLCWLLSLSCPFCRTSSPTKDSAPLSLIRRQLRAQITSHFFLSYFLSFFLSLFLFLSILSVFLYCVRFSLCPSMHSCRWIPKSSILLFIPENRGERKRERGGRRKEGRERVMRVCECERGRGENKVSYRMRPSPHSIASR